jgi:hypothetical protein
MSTMSLDAIRANAELVIERLGPGSGMKLGYDLESLRWLEGFIERQRARNPAAEFVQRMTSILGSFVGECLVRAYDGHWEESKDGWGVALDPAFVVFPFNKVRKAFDGGLEAGDSIVSFFTTAGVLLAERHRSGT